MTTKDADFLRESRRVRRRNLKRYWFSQSYRRIAGERTAAAVRPESSRAAARAWLVLAVLALAAAGVWSVLS